MVTIKLWQARYTCIKQAAHVLHRCETKASHTSCIRMCDMCVACMPCTYATQQQYIGAVRVHTIRAARVTCAHRIHSTFMGHSSTAFMLLSFCTCPTRLSEIPKCSTRVACMSEVCANESTCVQLICTRVALCKGIDTR